MDSCTSPTIAASPLPPVPWAVVDSGPHTARVVTADDCVLAIVVDYRGPAGTALRCAQLMAASSELHRVLRGLMAVAHSTDMEEGVERWLAQADALLARLGEAAP